MAIEKNVLSLGTKTGAQTDESKDTIGQISKNCMLLDQQQMKIDGLKIKNLVPAEKQNNVLEQKHDQLGRETP